MPSTENTTLQRIQREISEVIEREKELRSIYGLNGDIENNNELELDASTEIAEKLDPKPVLVHSKSVGAVSNGASARNGTTTNGFSATNGTAATNEVRRFTPNPSVKGVMHKFIKSRGKIATLNALQSNIPNNPPQQTWTIPDILEPPRVTDPSQCVRRGFVPVEVKMRKELEDLHNREMELRLVRRKSQPDFEPFVEIEQPQTEPTNLKKARSMAQLYNSDDYNHNFSSPPSNLKAARSLAELCDTNNDDAEIPGSHYLILQWEELIQKNQQARS